MPLDNPTRPIPSMTWIRVGACLALIGVALGAFGAHKLKTLTGDEQLAWWDTGVRYQMLHAFGLLFLGLIPSHHRAHDWAGRLFVFGVVVFSGGLYAMTLGGPRVLGAVVPIGGLAFIAGWACLALAAKPYPIAGRDSD